MGLQLLRKLKSKLVCLYAYSSTYLICFFPFLSLSLSLFRFLSFTFLSLFFSPSLSLSLSLFIRLIFLHILHLSFSFLTVHEAVDEIGLFPGLDADQVHATFAAVVPSVEPVPLVVGQPGLVAAPRHPVVVVAESLSADAIHSYKQNNSHL